MAKLPSERTSNHRQRVPNAPEPAAASAREGMESSRELARRYLPNSVRLYAAIAYAPDSEAALHTKMLSAKQLDAIAGVIPQPVPAAPQPYDAESGADADGAGDSRARD